MQVCTSLQTDNHASTPPLSFLHAGCPSCHPANSVKALKARLCSAYYAGVVSSANEIFANHLSGQGNAIRSVVCFSHMTTDVMPLKSAFWLHGGVFKIISAVNDVNL